MEKKEKKALPKVFGPTFKGHFPSEMRRQMWPLCCGAAIASGFKHAGGLTDAELDAEIANMLVARPDFQIFEGEQMNPQLCFLTLNQGQMQSPKIMKAIEKAGFKKIGEGTPRGSPQGFFLRDTGGTWKAA